MKTLVKFAIATAIAVALAAWSVNAVLNRPGSAVRNGPWTTYPTTGSAQAGLYHRARVAAHGLWALDTSEVIYYAAYTDSEGHSLRYDASYLIEGSDPDTRWWSITAYKDDHFIPNDLDRYSFSQTTVQRETAGGWVIRLSPEPRGPNWLPSGDRPGSMTLTLRCYNPGPKLRANPGTVALPRIVLETGS
jgi:hypothetical protein